MHLVFLHGGVASGKLTTARALSELTGLPVFHNHLVVDALLAVFPFGSPEFVRLRDQFWISTFDEAARSGTSLIFTFAPEPTVPADFSTRAAETIANRSGVVHFVELLVSESEQEARLDNEDRRRFRKLTSVETLRSIRARGRDAQRLPVGLAIDTAASTAAASALLIRDTFALPTQTPHDPFPA